MADIEVDELSENASIGGSEELTAYDSAEGMTHITPTQLKDWIIDQIEAITAATDADDGDSVMILEGDSDLKPVTMENFRQHIADVLWGKTAETSVDDADVLLLKDGGSTEKTVTATILAEYMLSENEPSILDISDKDANASPADADLILTVSGSTAKKTTWAQVESEVLAGLNSYMNALSAVSGTNNTDVLYCTQSGTEKKITLSDIIDHIAYPINGSGASGYLADWSDSDTLTNTYSTGTSFASGDNITLPTTKAVRDEMDEIVNDEADIGAALADGDDILVYDDSDTDQHKSNISRLWTYIWSKFTGASAKTTPVSADIIPIQDSADSNTIKEMTITNLMKALDIDAMTDIGGALADADLFVVDDGAGGTNRKSAMSRVATYIEGKVKLDDLQSAEDNTDLDATISAHGLMPKTDKQRLPDSSTELTIATGAITVTQAWHTIDTESDAATDDLDTVSGLTAGVWYTFIAEHTDRSVVFKHGTDNIICDGAADITADSTNDVVRGFSPDGTNIHVYLAVQGD